MTEANRANWYSDGENAARRIDDLLPGCVKPEPGAAAEPTLVDGRADFFPILAVTFFFFLEVSFLRDRVED